MTDRFTKDEELKRKMRYEEGSGAAKAAGAIRAVSNECAAEASRPWNQTEEQRIFQRGFEAGQHQQRIVIARNGMTLALQELREESYRGNRNLSLAITELENSLLRLDVFIDELQLGQTCV